MNYTRRISRHRKDLRGKPWGMYPERFNLGLERANTRWQPTLLPRRPTEDPGYSGESYPRRSLRYPQYRLSEPLGGFEIWATWAECLRSFLQEVDHA